MGTPPSTLQSRPPWPRQAPFPTFDALVWPMCNTKLLHDRAAANPAVAPNVADYG